MNRCGCRRRFSSRRIAKAYRERVDFMSVVGLDPPDFRTISEFRKRRILSQLPLLPARSDTRRLRDSGAWRGGP
jgi:Transposase domain (DUF772)